MGGGTDRLMDGAGNTEKTKVLLCCSLQLSKTVMAKALHSPQAAPSPQKIPITPWVNQREAERMCVCHGRIKKPRGAFNQRILKAVPKNKICICSASPEHSRPSQKSAGWFRREPAGSSAPLLHGTDWSGHSPGSIPKEQEGFSWEMSIQYRCFQSRAGSM